MKRHISFFAALFSLCTFADMNVTVGGYRIGETGQIQSNLLDPNIVQISPAGIKIVSERGVPVTFTATPGSDYAVVGWQGFTSNPLTSQDDPVTIAKADGEDGECRSVDIAFRDGTTWLYLVPVLKDLSGGGPNTMWVTPIGYRLGSAGGITDFATSVVAVSPDGTSIARKGFPLILTATAARDYQVVCWQKFVNVDPRSIPETPGVAFGEGSKEVSISPEEGVGQLFVAVVVKHDPVRTVTVGLSSFGIGKGSVSISPEKTTYLKGEDVTLTAEAAEGYSFVRWSDGNPDHRRWVTVDEDIDLKAYIEPISSRVSFSAGEGAVLGVTEKRVSFGNAYGELPIPTRTGSKFSGWMDDEKRTVTAKTEVSRVADHTLYASWGDLQYEIAWDFTGRGNGKVEGAGTYAYGSQPTLKAVPYEGSAFTGWTDGETRNPRRITVLSNALYVAAFDVATYDVSFTYRDAAGNLVIAGPTNVEYGGKVDPPSIPEWPEHTFRTWSTEEYKKVTRDLAVEAIYDTMTYSVAFTYRDWLGNCVTTMPQHVTAGGKANPPDRSVVDNWTGNTFKGWAPDYNVIRQDTLCEAIYETNTYTVTFSYRGSDGEPREQVETVQHGGMVQSVPETAAVDAWPGHRFLGWSNEDYLRPITGKLEVFARYEGYCTIIYGDALGTNYWEDVKDPKDWATLRPVEELSQMEDYAFKKTGHLFDYWREERREGTNIVVFTYADQAKVPVKSGDVLALKSKWKQITYTLKFDGNGGDCHKESEPVKYDEEKRLSFASGDFDRGNNYKIVGLGTNREEVLYARPSGTPIVNWHPVVSNLTTEANATVTLYVIWQGEPQTVTINGEPVKLEYGSQLTKSMVPDPAPKPGYAFSGNWTTNGEDAVSFPIVVTHGFDLDPLWIPIQYAVRFNANGGEGEPYVQVILRDVETALTSNRFARTGYGFANWTNSTGTVYADGAKVKDLAAEGETNDLYAAWTPNRYWIAFERNGVDGGTPMEPQAFTYDVAQALTSNAFTKTGHSFGGWKTNETGSAVFADGAVVSNLTAAADATNTLFAAWTPNKYTVVIDGVSTEMDYGFDIEKPADPVARDGYTFTDWMTNGASVAAWPLKVPVGGLEISSAWATNKYTVSFNPGEGKGEMTDQEFTYDEPQTLKANTFTAPEMKVFDCWTNAVNSTTYMNCATVCNLATGGVFVLYATWTDAPSYAVAFDGNGADGGSMATNRFECGAGGTLPANGFTRTGYVFDKWTNKVSGATFADGVTFAEDLAPTNETATLSALWTPNRYWIAFERNGADVGAMELQEFTYDVAQALTPNGFTKTGHRFDGWKTNETGAAVYADKQSVKNLTAEPDATNTLWAAWTVKSYEISFDSAGGSAVGAQTNEYGSALTAPANPTKTGYRFVEWRLNGVKFDFSTATMPAEDIKLVAFWAESGRYTVHFDGNGGTNALGWASYDQLFTNDVAGVLRPNEFSRSGHDFAGGWTNAAGTAYADGATVTNLTAESSIALFAVWMVHTHDVTWPEGTVKDVAYGTLLEHADPTPPAGYQFAGWKMNGKPVDLPVAMPDFDVAFEPTWTPNRYWVKFERNGADGGAGEMAPQAFTYDVAQALTSNAFTKTGHSFGGWKTNETGSAVFADGAVVSNLTAAADATNTLWAVWTVLSYEIRFDSAGGSAVGPSTNDYGAVVTAPTTAKTGHSFAGWYEGDDPFDFSSMPARNVTLTAHWTANPYTVEFRGPGDAYTQGFTYGIPTNLTANTFTPPEMMVFDRWTNAVNSTTYTNCATVCNLATGGVFVLYATWTDAPSYAVAFDGNGADGGSMATNRYECGKGGMLASNKFVRTGYVFDKWTNKVSGATFADGVTFAEDLAPTNETATLSALWTPNRYWIAFERNGADGGTPMEPQAFTYDAPQALTSNAFTKTGHSFGGWKTNETGSAVFADGAVVSNLTAAADATNTLFAAWTPNKYAVVIDGVSTNMDYGSDIEKPADPTAREGYTFTGWETNGISVAVWPLKVPVGGLTILSDWTANAYTVEFRGPGDAYTQNFTYDEPKALEANRFTAPEMMVFGCWTNAVNSTTYMNCETVCNLATGGVFVLYATWKDAPSYAVVFDGNGADGGSMATNRFECGAGGALPANGFTRTGYVFDQWTNKVNGATYANGATLEEDLAPTNETATLSALWTPNRYWVAFERNGADGGTPMEPQAFTYDAPQALTSNAFTKTGHSFGGWKTNETGSAVFADGAVVSNLTAAADATNTLWATWTPNKYAVVIDGASTNMDYGSDIEKPADPAARDGYTFTDWTTNGASVAAWPLKVPVDGLTILSDWTANTYTVEFRGTDGTYETSGTMEPQAFTYDVAQALSANGFTRDWHVFAGWTNGAGRTFANQEVVSNLTATAGGVVTLWATWTDAPSYAVRFNPNGGEGAPYVQGILCGVETALTPNRFARTGHGFANWTNSTGTVYADGAKVKDLAAEGETNDLYAAWTPNRYWVAFERNGADGGTPMEPQAFTYDVALALTSNAFTKTGHSFGGWKTNETDLAIYGDGAVVSNLTAAADATNTLFAAWTPNKYAVVIDGVSTNMDYGSDIGKPADPAARDGYTFTDWMTNGASVAAWPLKVPVGGLEISSAWATNKYTVSFNPGEGKGEMTDQEFTYDEPQTLKANTFTAPEMKVFDCWTNAVNSTTYMNCATVCNLATGGVFVLYATWTDAPSYAVAFDGNGADGGSMATNRYECGKGGMLASNKFVRTGYVFDKWTNKVSGATFADGVTFAEDLAPTNETATLSALWTPNRYWIAFERNGADGGTTMEPQAFTYDAPQALTSNAFTKTGHSFGGWKTNETGSAVFADGAVVSNLTAAADATNTLFAAWTPNKYAVVIDGVSTNMDYGSDIEKPADPAAREGYTFTGWETNGISVAVWPLKVPVGGLEISSAWATNKYTVEFRGTGDAYTQDFTYDEPQALEPNRFTAPEMKVFDRWTNAIDSTTYADRATVCNLATGGVFVLYATWTDAPSYAVAFDGNGADGGSMATNRYECGKGGMLASNKFVRTGYVFDKWTNKVSGATFADGVTFAEDLAPTNETATLSALWTPNRYWVKFEGNGVDGGKKMENQAFTYDVAQALTSNSFTRTGYGFGGWKTNETDSAVYGDGAVVSNLTAEANATNTLWATWTANTYTVRYNPNGGKGESHVQEFTYDQTQALANNTFEPPVFWMKFSGWTNATEKTLYAAGAMVSNLTAVADGIVDFYAVWGDDSYTVSFDGNGNTGGSMEPQVFKHGETKALTPNTYVRTGCGFAGWATNDADVVYTNEADFHAPTNGTGETLYAVWTNNIYDCTFIERSEDNQRRKYGEKIDPLPLNPSKTGYTFEGWTTNGSDVVDLSAFTMPDHDVTFTSLWEPITYTIAFDGNGAMEVAMAPINVKYDVEIALPSNTYVRAGYEFDHWTNTVGDVFRDGAPVPVEKRPTIDGARMTLYAVWQEMGNPLAIALGLDPNFDVESIPEGAWTIVGDAKEKKGLQRTAASPAGTLRVTVPSGGTLRFKFDVNSIGGPMMVKFAGEEIEPLYDNAQCTYEPESGGFFEFYGTPAEGTTWTLKNFGWNPAK